jgi:hypothetical protein
MREGSRSEVLGFRNFEPRTSIPAFLACLTLYAPRSMALAYFISNLLEWEERAPTEDSIGTAETLAGL